MRESGERYWQIMKLVSGARFPGGLSPWNDGSVDGPLRHRLENADYHATGRRVPEQGCEPAEREVILPARWEILRFDPETHTATDSGLQFVAVQFHSSPPPARGAVSASKKPRCRRPGERRLFC